MNLFFKVGYRWTWETLFRNLRSCYWSLYSGIKNLWVWLPIIWEDYNCDWSPLARIMSFKLRRMAATQTHLMNSERYCKQMRICAAILDRLREGRYDAIGVYSKVEEVGYSKETMRLMSSAKQHDLELLGKLISKHILCWWD